MNFTISKPLSFKSLEIRSMSFITAFLNIYKKNKVLAVNIFIKQIVYIEILDFYKYQLDL